MLNFINAGHPAPFLLSREGHMVKLHTSGMPVGMIEGAPFQVMQTQLMPGDKIVVYSDGFTEAENAEGEFFDTERLRLCLRDHPCRFPLGQHSGVREMPCAGGYRALYRVRPDTGRNDTAGDVRVLRVFGPGQMRDHI